MDRLLSRMSTATLEEVRTAYITYVQTKKLRTQRGIEMLSGLGYEVTDTDEDILVDGREVISAFGARWVQKAEIYAALKMEMMEARAKKAAPNKTPAATHEAIAQQTCPQMSGGKPCGGALNRAPVCPSCVTGRMGYRYRYTCESCGCDIVTREELR